jgi:DNA-directed RNA polymerase specialized sigma24 family protein
MTEGRDDAGLVARLRAGDPDALEGLYDRYAVDVHDVLARCARDGAAAEDLTPRVFLRAWERRAAAPDGSRARAWLCGLAGGLALSHGVGGARREPVEEGAPAVWAAAAGLDARQYAVLDLSVRRGLTAAEVAGVLEVPAGHAEVLALRAREALGSAVRSLLVARRRDGCPGLAALVPAGMRVLTAPERAAVDEHVGRCRSCRDLDGALATAAQRFAALAPVPLPAALAGPDRPRLVPPRSAWTSRPLAAAVAALLVAAAIGVGAAVLLRPEPATPVELASRPAASPSVSAPPPATPEPSPSPTPEGPSPSPTAVPVALAVRGTPKPPAPSPSPTASPTPAQPLVVRETTVRWTDGGSCPSAGQGFACHFTVTVTVSGANGGDAVTGTLTALTQRERVAVTVPATVPARGATTVAIPVTATFRHSPCGVAAATTGGVTSRIVLFGSCR